MVVRNKTCHKGGTFLALRVEHEVNVARDLSAVSILLIQDQEPVVLDGSFQKAFYKVR